MTRKWEFNLINGLKEDKTVSFFLPGPKNADEVSSCGLYLLNELCVASLVKQN